MHRLSLLALALSLALLPLALASGAGAAPAAPIARPSVAATVPLVKHAKTVCGMFDGHFTCKSAPGSVPSGGKSAIPSIAQPPSSEEVPAPSPGEPGTAAPAAGGANGTACQHGMVGTPPNDCRCPESSELLGGNCVHYTARCNVAPEPCPRPEEKLVCKLRPDGQKNCCCLTYDQ